MFEIKEGVWTTIGLLLVGVVGYKVIQKTNPEFFKGIADSLAGIKNRTCNVMEAAVESFREGYGRA